MSETSLAASPLTPLQRLLTELGACDSGLAWVGTTPFDEAWDRCTHTDWMRWFLEQTDLVTCDCTEDYESPECPQLERMTVHEIRAQYPAAWVREHLNVRHQVML